MDADDLLEPEKIRFQTEAAASASCDVAVIYSPWQKFEKHGNARQLLGDLVNPNIGDDPLLDLLQDKNFIATGSQLIRRIWLERVGGFNESYKSIEDVDLALRMAMSGGRFLSADCGFPLMLYRQRAGSLSRESRREFIDGCIRNASLAEEFWKETSGALTIAQRDRLTEIYGSALPFYIEQDRQRFRSLLAHVLELDPDYQRGGRTLRWLTRFLGHAIAESIAACYRKVRYRSLMRS